MSDYIVHNGIRIASEFVPETFGRLTTIGPRFKVGSRAYQVFLCSCGNVKVIRIDGVLSGAVSSCGCLFRETSAATGRARRKHGEGQHKYTTPEYTTWMGMRRRCTDVKDKSYIDYGGRGISVCPEWDNTIDGYANFLAYMGRRPLGCDSIERENVSGNYEPGNCRWATRAEQNRNKRNNLRMEAFGRVQILKDWAIEYSIPYKCLWKRIKMGWGLEVALTTPSGQKPISQRQDAQSGE